MWFSPEAVAAFPCITESLLYCVPKKKWYDAIHARKNGTATKEQEELLKNGHCKEQ